MPQSEEPSRYCREIHLELEEGRATGELVDDFHHFRATIEHDGTFITAARGEALRVPWATCPGAVDPLRLLEGRRLVDSALAARRLTPSAQQCTHLHDAACLAIGRAGRGAPSVVYRVEAPDPIDGRSRVSLWRNGVMTLVWDMENYTITDPAPYNGRVLFGDNFAAWAQASLDVDTCEAAIVLHRASIIAGGRSMDLDQCPRAIDVPGTRVGVCHTYSDEHGAHSFRVVGSARRLDRSADPRRASLHPTPEEILRFSTKP